MMRQGELENKSEIYQLTKQVHATCIAAYAQDFVTCKKICTGARHGLSTIRSCSSWITSYDVLYNNISIFWQAALVKTWIHSNFSMAYFSYSVDNVLSCRDDRPCELIVLDPQCLRGLFVCWASDFYHICLWLARNRLTPRSQAWIGAWMPKQDSVKYGSNPSTNKEMDANSHQAMKLTGSAVNKSACLLNKNNCHLLMALASECLLPYWARIQPLLGGHTLLPAKEVSDLTVTRTKTSTRGHSGSCSSGIQYHLMFGLMAWLPLYWILLSCTFLGL